MTTVSNSITSNNSPKTAPEDGFFNAPIPTYSVPFPPHFCELDKRLYRPIKTSYYTAWVYRREPDDWIRPFLENKDDAQFMREARKVFYGGVNVFEAMKFQDQHARELNAVMQEYFLAKQAKDSSFIPMARFLIPGFILPTTRGNPLMSCFFRSYEVARKIVNLAVDLFGIAVRSVELLEKKCNSTITKLLSIKTLTIGEYV
jgi:hypothetical protein